MTRSARVEASDAGAEEEHKAEPAAAARAALEVVRQRAKQQQQRSSTFLARIRALLAAGLFSGWVWTLGKPMREFEVSATILNISQATLLGDVKRVAFVASTFVFAFSAAAAALYLRKDEETGEVAPDRSIWDFLFMQFVWPLVDYPSLELGFDSPHAGERHYGGSILMMFVGLTVGLISQKLLIAMMTSTFQEMKRNAKLRFEFHRVSRVVRCASRPREPPFLFLLEFIAVWLGRLLFKLRWIDFAPDGGWRDRPAFRWEFDDFQPSRQALEHARSAQRRSSAVLLGEAQATIETANEAVRHMSGSRREREAQPSSETVHHIVKAEVSALKTEVSALDRLVKAEVSALEAKFDGRLCALDAKLETIANSVFEIARELQADRRRAE